MSANKPTVSITFEKQGIKPPVYLAGSFSVPPWQPTPMQYAVGQDNEYHFHAKVDVDKGGEYQYKFRVGEGDWILDEASPIVTDDQGNRNNLLIVASTKGEAKGNQPTASPFAGGISSSQPSNPTLVVEKTGAEPRHGDDFGDSATEDQREAQRMRSSDAEPDQVIVTDQEATYSANTAAEVADSAARLDVEQPTPPITDEMAGRIGFRRLSQTPIEDVAAVASEVSDSAALMDTDEQALRIEMPPAFSVNNTASEIETPGSGEVTPWEDRAPRFAHECVCLPEAGEQQAQPPRPQYERSPAEGSSESESSIDLNDPSIEDFPCDRELILQRVRTSATRLSEDETVWQALATNPAAATDHNAVRSESSSSSGRVVDEVRTPSLGSIPEEHGSEESLSAAPPHIREQSGSQGAIDGKSEALAVHKEQHEPETEAYEPNSAAHQPASELTHNTVPPKTSVADMQSITSESSGNGLDAREVQTMDGADTETESFPRLLTNPDSYQPSIDTEGYGELLLPGQWPVAKAQASSSTSGLRARTSRSAAEDATGSGIDSSSASHLTTRKSGSPKPERPPTPTSVRSMNFVAKSRALLRNFLRMIFVDWIGGVIRRLCGRRRT